MQAQDRAGVKWAIGLRCGAQDAAVEQAFIDKRIIRTWLLRGTLQIVAAEDIHWLIGLLGPRIIAQSARRRRQLELDDQTLSRSFDILSTELVAKGQLTRKLIIAALEREGIAVPGQRAYHILRQAALAGLICFGPMQGKEESFVLLDALSPSGKQREGEEALAELALRYFNSHGPATLDDFTWWSGLPKAEARSGLELCRPQLRSETVDDRTYWWKQGAVNLTDKEPRIYLLPAYDEYYLGYKIREAIIDASYDAKAISSGGVFRPFILSGGQIIGTWRRKIKKKSTQIDVNLFRTLYSDEKQALPDAAERYGSFLGVPVIIPHK